MTRTLLVLSLGATVHSDGLQIERLPRQRVLRLDYPARLRLPLYHGLPRGQSTRIRLQRVRDPP